MLQRPWLLKNERLKRYEARTTAPFYRIHQTYKMKAGSSRDVREKKLHRVPKVILTLHHTSDHLSMAWYIVRKRVSIRPQRRIEMLLIYSVLFSYRGVRVKSLTSTTLRNAKVLINLTHATRRVNNSEVP